MLGPLTDLLDAVLCFFTNVALHIANGGMALLNFLILGLASLISELLDLLPAMPDLPSVPSQMTTAASWFAWVFPVETVVELFAFVVVAYIAMQVVLLGMRWAKATDQ